MWVYPSDEVRTSPETTALLPQLPAESGTPKQSVPEPLNAGEAMPDGVAQQPERLHRRMRHASRDCCLLAAAFLIGTAAAGSLQELTADGRSLEDVFLSLTGAEGEEAEEEENG